MAEREQLMGTPTEPWATEHIKPADVTLHCWSPERAEREFLGRFYALTRALQIADGPTEVHLRTMARLELKKYTPSTEAAR